MAKRSILVNEDTHGRIIRWGTGLSDTPLGTPDKLINALLNYVELQDLSKEDLITYAKEA